MEPSDRMAPACTLPGSKPGGPKKKRLCNGGERVGGGGGGGGGGRGGGGGGGAGRGEGGGQGGGRRIRNECPGENTATSAEGQAKKDRDKETDQLGDVGSAHFSTPQFVGALHRLTR